MTHRSKILILFCINGLYFISYLQRVGVPGTVFNQLQTEFSLSASGVAALASLYLYIYGGMQLFAGIMADAWGASRMLLIGGTILTVGSLAFPCAPAPAALYMTRALVGIGASLIFLSILKEIDTLFDEKDFPVVLSITCLFGSLGGLFGTLPLERLTHLLGWRGALLTIGGISACFLACTAHVLRRTRGTRAHAATPFSSSDLRSIMRNPHSYPVLLSAALNFSLYFLIQATIGKKFLEDCCRMSSPAAASFTLAATVAAVLSVFGAGYISRALGKRRPLLIAAVTITLAAFALLLMLLRLRWPGWCFLIPYFMLGISTGSSPVFCTAMKELNRPEVAATSVGYLNAICYLFVALVTTAAGLVLDFFRSSAVHTPGAVVYPPTAYQAIFSVCLVMACISLALSLFIKESFSPRRETAEDLEREIIGELP